MSVFSDFRNEYFEIEILVGDGGGEGGGEVCLYEFLRK